MPRCSNALDRIASYSVDYPAVPHHLSMDSVHGATHIRLDVLAGTPARRGGSTARIRSAVIVGVAPMVEKDVPGVRRRSTGQFLVATTGAACPLRRRHTRSADSCSVTIHPEDRLS